MIHYSKTLTPSQTKEMNIFLHTLLQASNVAKEAGSKPDVRLFMKVWIGLPITEDGKKQRKNIQYQDWKQGKRAAGK